MTTATQLVAKALSYRGTTENPAGSNCNPFSHYLGRGCHYWCADYTVAVLREMGVPIPPGADTSSTRMNLAAWKKAGRWVVPSHVRPGDVLFFHISGRNGSDHSIPDHTGFCVQPPAGEHVRTVEGNTSSDEHGSQDNGGGVFPRVRSLTVVIGAGRPAYDTNPDPVPAPQEDDMPFIITNEENGFSFLIDGGRRRRLDGADRPDGATTLAECRNLFPDKGKGSTRLIDAISDPDRSDD